MITARARLLVVTFWVGSLWAIGYVVVPTLFVTLPDSALAGTIAGRLFRIEAWIGIVSTGMLFVLAHFTPQERDGKARKQQSWLLGGMLVCILVGYFALQPLISALREAAAVSGGMIGDIKMQFGLLHGVSSMFYLVESLLGLILVWQQGG